VQRAAEFGLCWLLRHHHPLRDVVSNQRN